MSVRHSSAVWQCEAYSGGALLVLLALADHADADGICWPKVNSLADKCKMTARMVRRHLAQYRKDGIISVEAGGGRGKPSTYRFNLETLSCNSGKSNSLNCDSLNSAPETLNCSSQNPELCDIAIRMNHHESSVNRKGAPPSATPAPEPSAKEKKANRGTQLPDDFVPKQSHRDLARKEGVDLDREFAQFTDHYAAISGPRAIMRNWDYALSKWLRKAPDFAGRTGGARKIAPADTLPLDYITPSQRRLQQ